MFPSINRDSAVTCTTHSYALISTKTNNKNNNQQHFFGLFLPAREMSFVLTETHDIDSTLHAPINTTQRIKYTCLNASSNYLALGSTSGSIYLFSREPCLFLQLIPLSQGPVTRLQISPDEKVIALATTRGTVCLVTLKPNVKLITVSNEHLGERVECLCWNDNSSEIYIGDGRGKVSVLVVSIFTVNGIFQASSCSLMDLDSSVVQMSFESSMLLISTLTRCYLCNTNLEQYKQIGNQFRDGEYGACFYKLSNAFPIATTFKKDDAHKIVQSTVRSAFNLIAENNDYIGSKGKALYENLVKIYCARPSSRLWEVDPEGTVVKTHQFKEALAVAPQPIYKLHFPESLRVEKEDGEVSWPAKSTQFSRLFVIRQRFIFSFSPNGLYVIDPMNALVILWSNEYTSLNMAHVVDDKIYLMSRSGSFHCLHFVTVDDFISKLYERKLNQHCWRAIALFKPELLERKIADELNTENELVSLMSNFRIKVKEESGKKPGIVLVNPRLEPLPPQPSFVPEIEDNLSSTSSTFSTSSTPSSSSSLSDMGNEDDRQTEIRDALCEVQADLERTAFVLMNDLNESATEQQFVNAISKLRKSIHQVKAKYNDKEEMQNSLFEVVRSSELHCDNAILESLETQDFLRKAETAGTFVAEITRSFLDLNSSSRAERRCGFCKFPLSDCEGLKFAQPKFFDVGRILVEKFARREDDGICTNLCLTMPLLWREYVSLCDKQRLFASNDLLQLCLQTNDAVVFSALLSGLDRRRWRVVAEFLRRLENGCCLSCGKVIKKETTPIDWADVTTEIVKLDGPEAALQFLVHLNEALPRVSISNSVLQKIVFSKILKHHGKNITHVVDFDCAKDFEYYSISSKKVKEDLINTLSRDTERIVDKNGFGSGPHHWGMRYTPKSSTCPCCTLSLQTPVLLGNNGIALFPCGHAYHVNCLIQKKITKCNLHAK